MKDLGRRTGTGIVLAAVVLLVIVYGRILGVAVMTGLIAALATAELHRMHPNENAASLERVMVALAFTLPIAAALWEHPGASAMLLVGLVCGAVWYVGTQESHLRVLSTVAFGTLYIAFSLSHLVLLRSLTQGLEFCLVVILGVWANDVFAYLIGSMFGSHPMAPRISPKKSWEGFIAGTVGTVAVWAAAGPLLGLDVPVPVLAVIGLLVSLVAVLGDLLESRLKREAKVKDSGTLVPGHGGVLDRFDSLIPVAVVAYYALVIAGVR